MYIILFNAIAVIAGCAIGAFFRRGISEKYKTVLNMAMGLCAFLIGIQITLDNMKDSHFPVLFMFCIVIGALIGNVLKLDQRMDNAVQRIAKGSNLAEGITTGILLCCVGTLSMMGPVLLAVHNDPSYLITAASLNFITMIVLAASYGFWTCITAVAVFLWQGAFYWVATLSQELIPDELITEISIAGGVLIMAAGFGLLNIKDCKTINMLPALFLPIIFLPICYLLKSLFSF